MLRTPPPALQCGLAPHLQPVEPRWQYDNLTRTDVGSQQRKAGERSRLAAWMRDSSGDGAPRQAGARRAHARDPLTRAPQRGPVWTLRPGRTRLLWIAQQRPVKTRASFSGSALSRRRRCGSSLAARGESPVAFDRRCTPPGCVAPRPNTAGTLRRCALPAGRITALGATLDFHHGLLATCGSRISRWSPRTPAMPCIVSTVSHRAQHEHGDQDRAPRGRSRAAAPGPAGVADPGGGCDSGDATAARRRTGAACKASPASTEKRCAACCCAKTSSRSGSIGRPTGRAGSWTGGAPRRLRSRIDPVKKRVLLVNWPGPGADHRGRPPSRRRLVRIAKAIGSQSPPTQSSCPGSQASTSVASVR